ncbi:MAG: OsmC family protein [Anaerolineae bacterium]
MSEAKVTWTGPGLRLVGEANDGPAIVLDSSAPIFGTHSGPTPMELILLGLAGCTGMDVVSILSKQRQPLTGFQVKVSAEHADHHPKVYTEIHVEYLIYGKGVEPQAVERAIELSETKYCSASAMLSKAVEITHSYRIVEDQTTPHGKPGGRLES